MTRASWCGKVIGENDSFTFAAFFTSSDSPQEPPITSATWLIPRRAYSSSKAENAGEVMGLPSIHSATTAAPGGTLSNRRFPSAARHASICACDGRSGRRPSSTPVTESRQLCGAGMQENIDFLLQVAPRGAEAPVTLF